MEESSPNGKRKRPSYLPDYLNSDSESEGESKSNKNKKNKTKQVKSWFDKLLYELYRGLKILGISYHILLYLLSKTVFFVERKDWPSFFICEVTLWAACLSLFVHHFFLKKAFSQNRYSKIILERANLKEAVFSPIIIFWLI